MTLEARMMEHARTHGYPVPAVDHLSDDGTELGWSDSMGRRCWHRSAGGPGPFDSKAVCSPGSTSACTGSGTGRVPVAPGGTGGCIVHLDLHPLNVILTDKGPVVIDWPNADEETPTPTWP